MNIGVTGGNGFIGRHVVREIRKHKGAKVFVFGLPQNDILNAMQLEKFAKGKDVIIHAAAINRGTDDEIISGNVVGTHNVVRAVLKSKEKPKIIFLSSTQAGNGTIYGTSKLLSEKLLGSISMHKKISATIFRLPNVFGENCKPFYNSVVATFCYQVAHGEKLTVHKDSTHKAVNLIYVGDIAKTVAKEALSKKSSQFCFEEIKSTHTITVGDLAKTIQSFQNEKRVRLKSRFHKNLYETFVSYQRT